MQHPASQTLFCARRDSRVAAPGRIQPRRGDKRAGWLGGCSTCKVPFFHEQRGMAAPHQESQHGQTSLVRRGSPVANMFSGRLSQGVDAHRAHRSKAPLGLDFVLPYRRHDLGPISWCGGPAASVSRQPLVWSRDHNSGHVTTHRADGPHQTSPQSSLYHLRTSRLTTQNCAAEIYLVQNASRGLQFPLPTPIWFKHCHKFHVGLDAALQLGVGGHVAHAHSQVFSSDTQYRHCFPDTCHLGSEQARSSQSVIEGLKAWS